MGLINNIKLVGRLKRESRDAFAQFPDLIDAAIARRIHFVHIFIAHSKRVRQNSRHRGLTGSASASKEVRMCDFAFFDRCFEY
jgi:hypothetical protein